MFGVLLSSRVLIFLNSAIFISGSSLFGEKLSSKSLMGLTKMELFERLSFKKEEKRKDKKRKEKKNETAENNSIPKTPHHRVTLLRIFLQYPSFGRVITDMQLHFPTKHFTIPQERSYPLVECNKCTSRRVKQTFGP